MMRTTMNSLLCVALLAISATSAHALEACHDLVVVKEDTTFAGGTVPIPRGQVLYVEALEGDNVWTNAQAAGLVAGDKVMSLDDGLLHFLKVIDDNPQDDGALGALGNILLAKQSNEAAIDNYTRAIEVNDQNWRAHANRGIAHARLGEATDALADADAAVRISDGHAYSLFARGIVKSVLGKPEAAVAELSAAISKNPQFARAYLYRAMLKESLRDQEGALVDYNAAIDIDKNYNVAYHRRGNIWAALSSPAKALADYRSAIELCPEDAVAYDCLAWLLATTSDLKYRDGEAALENAKRANELTGYNNPSYVESLVAAYTELGDSKKMVQWRMKLIKLKIAHSGGSVKRHKKQKKGSAQASPNPDFEVFRYPFQ